MFDPYFKLLEYLYNKNETASWTEIVSFSKSPNYHEIFDELHGGISIDKVATYLTFNQFVIRADNSNEAYQITDPAGKQMFEFERAERKKQNQRAKLQEELNQAIIDSSKSAVETNASLRTTNTSIQNLNTKIL
jgi:hypothetical protein